MAELIRFIVGTRVLASAAAALVWCSLVLPASADPAVSSPNGKLTAFGGSHGDGEDDEGLGGLAGSYTIPIGSAFGAQFDGAWARVSDEDFANAGVHLFWRDPSRGLFGFYGGYAHLTDEGGIDLGRAGVEAQYFAGSLTLDAVAGVRFGDIDTEGYARARLDYYLVEDFKLSAGYLYEGESFATAGAEYQLNTASDVGISLFADARVHDEDSYTALAGVKFYFGEQMSLINRHRKQDPDGYLDLDLVAAQAAAAASARNNQSAGDGGGASTSATCPFVPDPVCIVRSAQCVAAVPALTPAQEAACGCMC